MAHQFLIGLEDVVYGTLRSNIIAQSPPPDLNKIYSLVIQEERHRTVVNSRESSTTDTAAMDLKEKREKEVALHVSQPQPSSSPSAGRGRDRGTGQANSVQQPNIGVSATIAPTPQDRAIFGLTLANEQWQTVLGMFKAMAPSASGFD